MKKQQEKLKDLKKSASGRLGGIASRITSARLREQRIIEYNKNPDKCPECDNIIGYDERKKFCDQSCAAKFNNRKYKKKFIILNNVCPNCQCLTRQKFCNNQCRLDYGKKQQLIKIKSGIAQPRRIKDYLIKQHGSVCMNKDCAWDFSKKPIGVELEHIDGNSENNTLDNCILLCPNCHSLTPTYKNKNKGKGRYSRRIRYKAGLSY